MTKSIKKKIHVVSFTGDSGLTDYAVSLCRELNKIADIEFITADSYKPEKYRVSFPYRAIFRRTRHYPVDILKYFWFTLQARPDVVLFQSCLKFPLIEGFLVLIFRLAGIQMAMTIHDLLPHEPKPWSRLLLAWFYRRFNKLIVHSERSLKGLANMGVSTKPLMVPHGIYDIFCLSPMTRTQAIHSIPGLAQDDFIVLFFGHIDVRKGILEFLRTSELMQEDPTVKFVIAGARGPTMPASAHAELDRYAHSPNVVMHDHSIPFERVQEYFLASHVVALPYLEGTTSGVIKLAMAFQRPFIATDIGDFSETLQDWAGQITPGKDPAVEFMEAIKNMRCDYAQYVSDLSSKSQKYQWANIAEAHMKYFGAD